MKNSNQIDFEKLIQEREEITKKIKLKKKQYIKLKRKCEEYNIGLTNLKSKLDEIERNLSRR